MKDNFAEKAAHMDAPVRVEMARRFVNEIDSSVKLPLSSHLIDLGCGTGLVGLQLASRVAKVTMVDSSLAMLDILNEKIRKNATPNVAVQLGELNDYSGQPVDGIIALLVAHHVEDIGTLFNQVYSKLKDGGVFVVGDLVTEDGSFHLGETVPHNGFDMDDISSVATEQGFSSVKAYQYDTRNKNGRDYPLFILIAKK